jgi:beta-alanine degradation protein BauB
MFNKRTIRLEFAVGALAATLTLGGSSVAFGQPAPREYIAAPDTYSVIVENDQSVLVLGVLKPGQRTAFVSAPTRLNYWLTDCQYRSVSRRGEATDWKMRQGDAGSATTIEAISRENIGKSECRVLSFEPKEPSVSAGKGASAEKTPRSYVASPDIFNVIARNEQGVLVLADWKPGQRSNYYSQPARLSYSLTACELRYTTPKGLSWVNQFGAERGGAVAADESISVENVGSTECRVLIFQPD